MLTGRISSAALLFALCFCGSVLVGLAYYGLAIFDSSLVYFQFVAAGAIVGALTVAAAAQDPRWFFSVGLLAFVVLLGWNKPTSLALFLRDAIWIVVLSLSVRFLVNVSGTLLRVRIGKFVIWSAIFGALHLCMFSVLTFVNGVPFDWDFGQLAGRLGALIGAGCGLGFEAAGLVNKRVTLATRQGIG